ncbi:MAG: 4-hydroxybenzoate octaprenyltransferase [Rhodospirillales bacterium]|nr:4-hydroxybenzoate octaprenyltransferase [Alphaproteobacteria bacterium]MCB9986523.1 4-hydroxybenzoate octaprenyltransferase [Rhodospirillales bacterium]USO06940.1 MAG: 4-hydroxybenzoate octaprenyltransferase [Rhodospirillales bacterium]
MGHTDITNPKWFAPLSARLRVYAHLMRLDRPIGTWLLLLPGWWAIALAHPRRWDLFFLFGAGAVIMRGAGCVINDLWDRDLDASVERTRGRPLVTGAASRREAFALVGVLFALGAAILLSLSTQAIALGILSLAFVVTYPLMKRFTWWPQLFLGFTFNFGALIGWAAAAGRLEAPALWLYAGGIFWTLGYDTIYAHQDREDDALAGIKSTARLFGNRSKIWVAGFYAAAIALWSMAMPTPVFAPLLTLPALHFAWQVWRWDMDDPASSLRFFKSNRDAGLILLAVFWLQVFS